MADAVHDAARLKELQALPLERKIQITQTRIIEWYQHYNGSVCISFSGGKDSTVLLHIARQLYPDIPAVFSNTGLEYPEIQRFVKSIDNVDIVTPAMRFDQVISTYGYPLIGKEVAEAIYYARRIRSQSVNVERERERAAQQIGSETRRAVQETDATADRTSEKRCINAQCATGSECTSDLPSCPKNPQATRQKNHLIETSTARNRRTVLSGKMGAQSEWKRMELGGQTRRREEISGALTTDENLNRIRRAGVARHSGSVQKSQEDTETAEVPG